MKLIVESGATKTAWRAVHQDGRIVKYDSAGLSPTCTDIGHVNSILREAVPTLNPEGKVVEEVVFYGAGLVSSASNSALADGFALWCPFAEVSFHSDILAAARALFGDGSGVVAIMGTGSNSCLYEDGQIVRNIRPGGYVLGDEGGAVTLGRMFLADYVKGLLPEKVEKDFIRQTGLDYPAIVGKVYKEPSASAFMASLAPFVMSWTSEPQIRSMLQECLESFVRRALVRYSETAHDPVAASRIGVVGSFGYACREYLHDIGREYGLEFVKFVKSPIDELTAYHIGNM